MRMNATEATTGSEAWHLVYSRDQLVAEIEQLRDELRQLGGEVAVQRHLRKAAERDLLAFVEHARNHDVAFGSTDSEATGA